MGEAEAAAHDPIQMLELRGSTQGAVCGELGPGVLAVVFLLLLASSFL